MNPTRDPSPPESPAGHSHREGKKGDRWTETRGSTAFTPPALTRSEIQGAVESVPLTHQGLFSPAFLRGRLVGGLEQELRTIDKLVRRYHLRLEDLAHMLLPVAVRWHETRPLSDDIEWTKSSEQITAPVLRRRQRAVREAADLLRDLREPLAGRLDKWIAEGIKQGLSPDQAMEMMARNVSQNSTLGLGRHANGAEILSRLNDFSAMEWRLAEDADLFAIDTLLGLNGRAIFQAAVVALRFAETVILGTEGRLDQGRGRPRTLDHIREEGRRLTSLFRDQTKQELPGYATALLAAVCPSESLSAWRNKAFRQARAEMPRGVQRDITGPDHLSPGAHTLYLEILGRLLKRELKRQRIEPKVPN